MTTTITRLVRAVLLLVLLGPGQPAWSQQLCLFNLEGAQGPLYGAMQDYAVAALDWDVSLELAVYTNERIAAEAFKAGRCDGVLLTGIRARRFNAFTGSIDSVGGLWSYEQLRVLLETLTRPELAGAMRQGPFETAGILPLGAAYLFLDDRRITSAEKLAGHKMAVFEHDEAQMRMAQRIGVTPVPADVSSFAPKFNNGIVNAVVAPATAYMPLELYRGVGARGLVIKLPMAQLTFQILIRHERFPDDFAQYSRRYIQGRFDDMLALIRETESEILFFYPPPDADRRKYRQMLHEARRWLVDEGIYDRRMMTLMQRVRCHLEPQAAECSATTGDDS